MPSHEHSLQLLVGGNNRFAGGKMSHPNQTPQVRKQLTDTAKPFAAILTCSDSRVAPELIFDCGLGDLFVIRNAGHVINETVLGSLEFAVDSFQIPLIVVVGHTHCLAIETAVTGTKYNDNRRYVATSMEPIISQLNRQSDTIYRMATNANVLHTVSLLKKNFQTFSSHYKAEIIGAVYNIETGMVEW